MKVKTGAGTPKKTAGKRRIPGFATACVHAGQEPEPVTGAVAVPIFQTSTYVQESFGKPRQGYEYARTKNPTRLALETQLAALEGGAVAHAFASGMAAETSLMLSLVKAGDHVLVSRNTYGGTYRFFSKILANFGLTFDYVDTTDPETVRAAVTKATRMLFVETPTNPTMEISDLEALAAVAKDASKRIGAKIRVVVDNTFATPFFQRPLALGCDVVVHSTTKYLNGHSDSVGGAVICADPGDGEKIGFTQNAAGAILSPFDSFLVSRGIKTLPVRMRAHDANGRAVAEWLASHPKVKKVFYPGLRSHPGHAVAARQMSGFGGMISFDLGSVEAVKSLLDRVVVCALGESLGGVESLISHPASMTHASVEPEERVRRGITPGLVRVSVGIEDVEDILQDLENALAAV
ncbi:MAG TPA: cystathionine gamma-synthase [Thermoanaerobaculia bacterium]|jgi:cystathionine gamma-lyase/cystathionine beta-lyase/cystathionine gamma-lyase/homocysteine desulfhydrase|nr:cystathionine gamma-synthase [Thermoanaerobaculia bacterium]